MKTLLAALLLLGTFPITGLAEPIAADNYSKLILGRWLGSKKYEIYYADGTWAVQRNDIEKPEKAGRWHIDGHKIIITSGAGSGTETIVTLTKDKFVTEVDGFKEERTRVSR